MKKLINEISTIDAWNRFYKDKIPEKIYKLIMLGTNKMTPWHKMLLDKYIKESNPEYQKTHLTHLKPEELIVNICKQWSELNNDAKQCAIEDSSDGTFDDFTLFGLEVHLDKLSKQKGFSENYYAKDGIIKLYESNNLLVTCTVTYSASKKYYGDSHWCTASDILGRYNGHKMFRRYTNYDDDDSALHADECLIQFVDKNNRTGNTYQIQYIDTGEEGQICDFMDKECDISTVIQALKELGEDYHKIKDEINLPRLIDITDSYRQKEDFYWSRKINKIAISTYKNFKNAIKDNIENLNELAKNTCKNLILKYSQKIKRNNGAFLNFTENNEEKIGGKITCSIDYGKYNENYDAYIFICTYRIGSGSLDDIINEMFNDTLNRYYVIIYKPKTDSFFFSTEGAGFDIEFGKMLVLVSTYSGPNGYEEFYSVIDLEKLEYLTIDGHTKFDYVSRIRGLGNGSEYFQILFTDNKQTYYLINGILGKIICKSIDSISPTWNNDGVIIKNEEGKQEIINIPSSQNVNEVKKLIKKLMD